jgi:hypothetical protein
LGDSPGQDCEIKPKLTSGSRLKKYVFITLSNQTFWKLPASISKKNNSNLSDMKKNNLLSILFSFTTLICIAQTADNAELQKMYDEDQRGRSVANIDWRVLSRQDSAREARVYELIKEGKVVTGRDYYNSAMIFQHGRDTTASRLAVEHMKKAIELDSTINKWLLAAAIDRDLMRRNEPQIYGTQYIKMYNMTKWERYKIDSTKVTDQERKAYGVETLAQQKEKERRLNLLPVSSYHEKSSSVDKTVEFIKDEFKKGIRSEYDVSESGINAFGYQLMAADKNEDALKVFKLNTELYPTGYNTFDSYGECLMKVGRKAEAMKAYQKSLELNPKNENARKILSGK